MSAAPSRAQPGAIVQERYRLIEELARGGMGVVFRAEHVQLGRSVAIKFLHAPLSGAEFIKRFEREALMMSRLVHPNCVSVIDFGVEPQAYIVMEFVAGETLTDVIARGAMPVARAVVITRQLLAALAHAHEKGIVHRDIKPANIVLAHATGAGDHVRVLDFGLARLADNDSSLPSQVIAGTPNYMSPEQARAAPADARSDVYSAGLVLFELLTGVRPFCPESPFDALRLHVEQPAPPLSERAPGAAFSAELEAAVARSLAKAPVDRFQTPTEMADALAEVPEVDGARRQPRAEPIQLEEIVIEPTRRHARPGFAARWWLIIAGGALAVWLVAGRPGLERVASWVSSRAPRQTEPASPRAARSVAEAVALAEAGDRDRAISALHDLRRRRPADGEVSFELGRIYFAKDWWSEGIASYREAIRKDRRLARRSELVRDALSALGRAESRERARALFLKQLGRSALPALREAMRSHGDRAVRLEARRLITELRSLAR